ncbi:hypothetical protein Tco_0503296 [Tanacetum coccineum]
MSTRFLDQARKKIKLLKAKINKKQAKPVIKHHKEYLKSVSLHQRFPRKSFSKKHRVHKKNVSKQGRKIAKGESSVQKILFHVHAEDKMITWKQKNAQSEGWTTRIVTDFEKVSTYGSKVSTKRTNEGSLKRIFEGAELKDVEEIDRPRPTSQRSLLTLKPLPKIDPKDKGKKKIEEEDDFKNKIAEEEATNEALIKNFDDIKARIEADRILAEKLQEQERENVKEEEKRRKKIQDRKARYLEKDEVKKKEDSYKILLRWGPSDIEKRMMREDLDAIYKLVMDIYQDKILEGFDKSSLGDLLLCSIQMNKKNSRSHAIVEEVSYEKEISNANAKAKIGV